MNLKDKVTELKESGLSWKQVAEELEQYYPNLTMEQRYDKARNAYRDRAGMNETVPGTEDTDTIQNDETVMNKTVEYKATDGTTTFNGIIALMDGEPITPEAIMRGHNLDTNEWEVVSHKSNFYQQQKKGGTALTLYQSKITVKPKKKDELTLEDIDKYFENKDYSKNKLPIACTNYDKDGEILEIDIADLHVGLLAHKEETGGNYDLKIARDFYFRCINDIIERSRNRKFKKIVFVSLGDFLHVDNDKNETVHGTRQDTDSRIHKTVEYAEDMLIDGITMLGELAPVEFVYLCGNHDFNNGYMLVRSIKNAFRNDKNVTFDITPNPIKHRLWGINLVMFNHGNISKNNMDDLVYKFAREDFGKSKVAEIHSGHLHDLIVRTKCGTVIRTNPTVCLSSAWEHISGYSSPVKAIVSYVWNESKGLRDIWYSNI